MVWLPQPDADPNRRSCGSGAWKAAGGAGVGEEPGISGTRAAGPVLDVNLEGIPMAVAAKKQNTVTMRQIAADLADKHELTKRQTNEIMESLITQVAKHLKKGDKIRMPGLGIFQVRHRKARMGRNPATGEPIKIKASKKVAFRVAKELKTSI
jgi:DNA-binding protein HU-beta